jgi:hypothetical protein
MEPLANAVVQRDVRCPVFLSDVAAIGGPAEQRILGNDGRRSIDAGGESEGSTIPGTTRKSNPPPWYSRSRTPSRSFAQRKLKPYAIVLPCWPRGANVRLVWGWRQVPRVSPAPFAAECMYPVYSPSHSPGMVFDRSKYSCAVPSSGIITK